jgi:HEPN domain-containing protein
MNPHKEWLDKAHNDIKSAKKLIKGNDPIYDTALYHAQQCAEKSLKAFLVSNQQSPERTHDLELLTELCAEIDSNFNRIFDIAIELNPFSTMYRYPGSAPIPDREDVVEAINKAEKIYSFVINRLRD